MNSFNLYSDKKVNNFNLPRYRMPLMVYIHFYSAEKSRKSFNDFRLFNKITTYN